jgi:hypothetical protein
MVRNWQSRVEIAEKIRTTAKNKKQRSEDKKLYKVMVKKLMGLLDRHRDPLRKIKGRDGSHRRTLHIWTDTLAADSSPPTDLHQPDEGPTNGSKQRKPRSGSVDSDEGNGGKKGYIAEKRLSKKKAHPRSHQAAPIDTTEHTSQYDDLVLCKPHFFAGKCRQHHGPKGGGGCRRMHYTIPQYKTLNTICSGDKNDSKDDNKSAREQVSLSEEAVPLEEDPDAMEMIYYSSHILANSDDKDHDKEEGEEKVNKETAVSDALNEALAGKGLGMASIVYVALDGVLIFDRYRKGVLLSDQDFLVTAVGGGFRNASGASEGNGAFDPNLPGQVLEYILTFLPDNAVSVASQVCKAWHHEIGRNSPNLWRHMLERREWPLPEIDHDPEPTRESIEMTQRLFREAFLGHYSVIRDVSAIQSAMGGLMMKRAVDKKEMSYQDFSTRKSAPSNPNACVSVQVWGPNRILAAYGDDCSLRLFATVPKMGSDESLCRELVCQRIDPYRNTKKRSCQIVAVGLDEEVVGSLCHVMEDGVDAESSMLVILSRDDFLQGSSGAGDSDAANLSVIDIGEAVINYLLSLDDDLEDQFVPMLNFLAEGGDSGEMEVLVSQTMAACGHGRFMLEVSISVPVLDLDDEDDGEITLQQLDRKLVLFSAGIGAIVWMGESQPLTHDPRPRNEDMTLTCVRRPHPGGSRASCHIAVACATSPVIMVSEIEPNGPVQSAELLDGSELVRSEILEEGWEMSTSHFRPVLITASDVVAADTMYREVENRGNEFRSVISFYPRYKGADDDLYSTLSIPGNMEIIRMSTFRDEHVVAICRESTLSSTEQIDVEDRGGQWFAGNMEAAAHKAVHAVIIHVPSRREIARFQLMDDVFNFSFVPLITMTNDDTIGVGVSWRGVIMTGSDVRSLAAGSDAIALDDTLTPVKAPKGKTARRKDKGGKKLGSRQKVKH